MKTCPNCGTSHNSRYDLCYSCNDLVMPPDMRRQYELHKKRIHREEAELRSFKIDPNVILCSDADIILTTKRKEVKDYLIDLWKGKKNQSKKF